MIDNVSAAANAAAPAAAGNSGQTSAGGKTVYHTPFGDVIVQEINGTLVSVPPDRAGTATTPLAQPASAARKPVPTLESEFGSQPFLDKPTGTGPLGSFPYNPLYFATRATADKVAEMLGGTVVEENNMVTGGPFSQSAPNEMIRFSDGREVNAGLVANFFNHGYPQSYIDTMIQKQKDGSAVI